MSSIGLLAVFPSVSDRVFLSEMPKLVCISSSPVELSSIEVDATGSCIWVCELKRGGGHQLGCRWLNGDSASIATWAKAGGGKSGRNMAEARVRNSGRDTKILEMRREGWPSPCYVNHDSNNWHFHANLSLEVLLVWDRDSAHIGDVPKPSSPAIPSWLWSRILGSSYQSLRHWQSHVSGKQASVDICQLSRDDGRVSSRKGDSGTVLSSSNKKASRSRRLQSEQKDNQHIDWCRSRLRYINGRSPS